MTPSYQLPKTKGRSIKQLYLTSADGYLHLAVIILKDQSVSSLQFHRLGNQGGYELWLIYSPKGSRDGDHTYEINLHGHEPSLSEASLPVEEEVVMDVEEEDNDDEENAFTSNDVLFFEILYREILVPIIYRVSQGKPSLLCYDGEFGQIEATFTQLLQIIDRKNIEILKLPAASTMLFQPNDVMRAHAVIHKFVHSAEYLYEHEKPSKPEWYQVVEKTLKTNNIAASSRLTFSKFFLYLSTMLGRAFKHDIITSGWQHSGLFPLNAVVMLNKISGWSQLTSAESEAILASFESLIDSARLSGVVEDKVIDERIGNLNLPRRIIESNDPVNHQRSLWLNKDGALTIRKAQEEERKKREQEQIQKEARKIRAAQQREIANEAAKAGTQLASEHPDENSYPIICARTHCRNYLTTNDDPSKWKCCTVCAQNPWFCANKLCQADGENHLKKCVYNHRIIETIGASFISSIDE